MKFSKTIKFEKIGESLKKLYKKLLKRKTVLIFSGGLVLGGLAVFFFYTRVLGEQAGSSPTSSSTSRIKTVSDDLTTKGKGATASGSWGDWGTMWNRIYSSAGYVYGQYNGTGYGSANCTDTFDLNCYTQAVGGVDDYNSNHTIPTDAYQVTWTTCNAGNTYCGLGNTGGDIAGAQDPNTGLIWSDRISSSANWFTANNCKYPNELPGYDGTCSTAGDIDCYCVKLTSSKTGCEARVENGGGWRLPTQKELMQAYIDGSWGSGLDYLASFYWSATTCTLGGQTPTAWTTYLGYGYTSNGSKTGSYSVRCVRP